ncbi:MAG: hypothetical protein FWF50_00135 [Defluviitaleaceae bacterium]|nr:hypothetical protein [Defluviitaleaceae bacterium]
MLPFLIKIAITNGTLNTGLVTLFRQGDAFAKVVAASGLTTGTVINPNFNVPSLGLLGQVQTNVFAREGDSGGVVFSTVVVGPVFGGNTAGVVTGGPTGGGNMFFTREGNISNAFGVMRY